MFIDEVEIHAKGGKGGDGCVAFLREKFRPWGGPAGGDGGKGGDVLLECSASVDTLLSLYRKRSFQAPNGQPGRNKNCFGKAGRDVVICVPPGTVIRAVQAGRGRAGRAGRAGKVLFDFTKPGQRFTAAGGGRGGRGNQHFATPAHQTPREFEFGGDGEERDLHLELKLIADAGLIGRPNAGKSTLLSRISAAHPRIASYPFTTKEPQLGIVDGGGYRQLVIADLPGLIEGAHAGAGLGGQFLKHVERTRCLIHLVDMAPDDGSDPLKNWRGIEHELKCYSKVLAERPRLVVANKIELPGAQENLRKFRQALDREVLAISALTGAGLKDFLGRLFQWAGELKGSVKSGWD